MRTQINQVKSEFGNKVLIAYRPFILDQNSLSWQSAIASECAGEQNKFQEMLTDVISLNKDNNLASTTLKNTAQQMNLNTDDFDKCLESGKYKDNISNQIQAAKQAGVLGVPTIFINGKLYPGAYPFKDFTDSGGEQHQGLEGIVSSYLK